MSEAYINRVTLDCLLNKAQYEKYVASKISKSVDKKDKNFYRKRILKLTKDLLITDDDIPDLLPDVKYAFDNFQKACIHFFKVLDNNDIVQSQHTEDETPIIDMSETENEVIRNQDATNNPVYLNTSDELSVDESNSKIHSETNALFARSTNKIINSSLNNFITIKPTAQNDDIIIPRQRNVDLQESSLKNKGLEKRKNITNIYEDGTKSSKQ